MGSFLSLFRAVFFRPRNSFQTVHDAETGESKEVRARKKSVFSLYSGLEGDDSNCVDPAV